MKKKDQHTPATGPEDKGTVQPVVRLRPQTLTELSEVLNEEIHWQELPNQDPPVEMSIHYQGLKLFATVTRKEAALLQNKIEVL